MRAALALALLLLAASELAVGDALVKISAKDGMRTLSSGRKVRGASRNGLGPTRGTRALQRHDTARASPRLTSRLAAPPWLPRLASDYCSLLL